MSVLRHRIQVGAQKLHATASCHAAASSAAECFLSDTMDSLVVSPPSPPSLPTQRLTGAVCAHLLLSDAADTMMIEGAETPESLSGAPLRLVRHPAAAAAPPHCSSGVSKL
jgi:hypothetical protein